MNRAKKAKDPKRNRRFAVAFDHMKRTQGFRTQEQLAERMGVSPETVSRIIKERTNVTEDAITRLQTASGCIFNLQWLRGDSDVMLAADVKISPSAPDTNPHEATQDSQKSAQSSHEATQDLPDMSSLMNSVIAAKDETIVALKRETVAKDDTITSLKHEVAAKNETVASLQRAIEASEALLRERESQIQSLGKKIAVLQSKLIANDTLDDYPFTVGVAEDKTPVNPQKPR